MFRTMHFGKTPKVVCMLFDREQCYGLLESVVNATWPLQDGSACVHVCMWRGTVGVEPRSRLK